MPPLERKEVKKLIKKGLPASTVVGRILNGPNGMNLPGLSNIAFDLKNAGLSAYDVAKAFADNRIFLPNIAEHLSTGPEDDFPPKFAKATKKLQPKVKPSFIDSFSKMKKKPSHPQRKPASEADNTPQHEPLEREAVTAAVRDWREPADIVREMLEGPNGMTSPGLSNIAFDLKNAGLSVSSPPFCYH